MLLLRSLGRFLSPYIGAPFELIIYPYGRNRAKTPARRSLRGAAKERQSNTTCSASSMPSFEGHNEFVMCLRLCLNF